MSFDPGTIALAAGGMKAIGSLFSSEGNAQSSEYNASIAQQNAVIAQQQGDAAAEAQSRDAERKLGSMIAGYGASGVEGTSGSPMDVIADSVRMATLDNLTTKYNYALKAQGFQNQATLDRMNASNSRTSGVLNGISSGMQGYAMYTKFGSGGLSGSPIPSFGGVNNSAGMDISLEDAAVAAA